MSVERFSPPENKEIPKILRIGVDLDDTVANYGLLYFRAIAMCLRVNIPITHPSFDGRVEDLPEIAKTPCSKRFLKELVKREFLYQRAKPIEGAIETLNRWKEKGHEIWFITARENALTEVTVEWLERYGLDWAVPRTYLKRNNYSSGAEFKRDICQTLQPDVFIDDMPHYLDAIDTPSVKLKIGLKKPWNSAGYKEGKNGYLLRNNWVEIAQEVENLM